MALQGNRQRIIAGLHIGGRSDARSGLIWGGFIALFGLALLLNETGVLSFPLHRYWPILVMCAGLAHILSATNRSFGVMLILIGGVFQINALGFAHVHFEDLWPVGIIVVGLLLMWGALRRPAVALPDRVPDSVDGFNVVAVLGGAERRVNNRSFKGGRVTTIFGGAELDFRDAEIEGDTAALELACIFGGVEIRVPDHWRVESASIPILGGYADKTRGAAGPNSASTTPKTLVITGAIIFGGVEISN